MNEITIFEPEDRRFLAKLIICRSLSITASKDRDPRRSRPRKRTKSRNIEKIGQKIDVFA